MTRAEKQKIRGRAFQAKKQKMCGPRTGNAVSCSRNEKNGAVGKKQRLEQAGPERR